MSRVGRQLLLDMWTRPNDLKLDDLEGIQECMREAATRAKTDILDSSWHKHEHGITGTIVLGESYLSVVTRRDIGLVMFNAYMPEFTKLDRAMDSILSFFAPIEYEIQTVNRGVNGVDKLKE